MIWKILCIENLLLTAYVEECGRGRVWLVPPDAWDNTDYWTVMNLEVHPEWRGLGLGRALMQRLVKENTDKNLKLNVRSDNKHAITIYKTLGFKYRNGGRVA